MKSERINKRYEKLEISLSQQLVKYKYNINTYIKISIYIIEKVLKILNTKDFNFTRDLFFFFFFLFSSIFQAEIYS